MAGRFLKILAVLIVWMPILWLASIALRPDQSLLESGTLPALPSALSFSGFRLLFSAEPYRLGILNACMISTVVAVAATLIAFAAGYAVTHAAGAHSRLLVLTIVSSRFLPSASVAPALYLFYVTLHVIDTRVGLILANLLPAGGLALLFMIPLLQLVRRADLDIARLEGATEARAIIAALLPQVSVGVLLLTLVVFAAVWNEYLLANLLSETTESQPLSVIIATGIGQFRIQFGAIASAAMLSLLPAIASATLLSVAAARSSDDS